MADTYDFSVPVSWQAGLAVGSSFYVQLSDLTTGLNYVSINQASPGGKAYFLNLPNGLFAGYVSALPTGPWTLTQDSGITVSRVSGGTTGVDLAVRSITVLPSGPYGAFLPHAPTVPTPSAITTGNVWDAGGGQTDWRTYGVLMDGVATHATINNGSANVIIDSTYFTSTAVDANKLIKIIGAGVAGADLKARILTVTDSTHATLDTNASTSVVSKFCVFGTDNTTACNTALADAPNWSILFTGPGLCLINGTLNPAFDVYSSGKTWRGTGRSFLRGRGAAQTNRYLFSGTYICQLADAIPIVKTTTTDTSIGRGRMPYEMSLGYFTPQTNAASVGWLWSGMTNTNYAPWFFGPVSFFNCYIAVAIDSVPGGIAVWDGIYDIEATATKHNVINYTAGTAVVMSHFLYLGIFNTAGANEQPVVASDGVAINLFGCELLIEILDVEGWYNQIFLTTGTALIAIRGCHVEHHTVNVGGVNLFDFGNVQAMVDILSILATTTAGANTGCWCISASGSSSVWVKAANLNWTLNTAGIVGLALSDVGSWIEVSQIRDLQAGTANAVVAVSSWTGATSRDRTWNRSGFGRRQTPAFAAAPTPDFNLGEDYQMAALTGAVNVGNPLNPIEGQRARMIWTQDGTGGRAVAYTGGNWRSVGIAAQVTTLNTVTIDEAECVDGTIWRVNRLVTGQTI